MTAETMRTRATDSPVAAYVLRRALKVTPAVAFEFLSSPASLVELGTAKSVRSELLGSDSGVVRRRVYVTEAPFGRCCPQITVAAMMMSSAADLTVSFSSNSQGTAVSHVYGFQAAEGGCVCTDTVEITNVPPCSSCIVVPIARRSHTRTMDALAERFSGSHPALANAY